MSKLLRYFLFSSLVLSVLFLASCEEDTETPMGDLAVSLDPSGSIQAAPGDTVEVEVTLTNASAGAEATALSDSGGDFIGDNLVASGESVEFVVPEDAASGDIITLTFSLTDGNQQANAQLEITVGFESIVDIATRSDDFETLVLALTEAGLVDDLQGDGPFTVFAPNDDAFAAAGISSEADLPETDVLANILQYHVVSGLVLSTDLESGYYETLSGDSLYVDVTDDGIFVNGAEVLTADLEAGNGVIHEIEEVLLPDVTYYEAFLLAAPDSDEQSETFFSTMDGEIYSYDEVISTNETVSETIDFGYYYGLTANATLASPDAYPTNIYAGLVAWSVRNTTVFRSTNLSPEGFDALASSQGDEIEAEFEAGTALNNTGRATGLAADNVVAFQTEDGRFGLIKVVEIVDGNGDGNFDGAEDGIQIAVKVTQ
ncbi:putative surface protein with fasciclin (FAS1) repeats [Catalinimonas alkaloidigena]|uniref:fasciclin domain-containing protein n=1 Tax=Catalinimonas alkaloidigena TaxID=1075417 RepID=UPI0024065AFC|nr:fasciclin domain-containing protein [Catalinimonas alkaloidigena]MDF9800965.1 putative surface protein with fasciclin (FAS1) repeats [Catalinimonas alkaloidigena]